MSRSKPALTGLVHNRRIWVVASLVVVVAVIVAWVLLPFYFLVVASLAPHGEPVLGLRLPSSLTLSGFRRVLLGGGGQKPIWPYMEHSVLIAGGGTILAFIVSLPAAYGLSRLMPAKRARGAYLGFLALQSMPTLALVIAFFLLYERLGLIDSKIGLIVALLAVSVPFQVWVLKSFFDAVPRELEEAAELDGAGPLTVFGRVVLPLMGEALAATGVLTFLTLYVDFLFAVSLTRQNALTIPVYVVSFETEMAVNITATAAAVIVSMLPMIALYAFAQRYMQRMALLGA